MGMNNSPSVIAAGQTSTWITPLWWTYSVATGTTLPNVIKGFGDVAGSGNVTPAQTNMSKTFELEEPQSFTVFAYRLVPIGCTAADLRSFSLNYTNRFIAAGKLIMEAPLEFWSGGAGISTDPTNGLPTTEAIVNLKDYPVRLEAGITFRHESVGTPFATTGAFNLRVYLDGVFTRAVG